MIDPQRPDFDNPPASSARPRFTYAPADPEAAPLVTIVTAFYNEGSIFHETVRSVLAQSLQQWAWIIVNDASTDPEALEVLAGYRQADRRIRVVDLPVNQGPSAARNAAFRLAGSAFVAHLDSDNLLEPTALEKWWWYLESHPDCAFVKGFSVGFGAERYLWEGGFHEGRAFLTANRIDTTSMIRRDVHRAVGGFDESIREGLEDWEFWIRCASAGFWGDTVPEYLDWYRRRPSHADRWSNWDGGPKEHRFGLDLRRRFPALWRGTFPTIRPREHIPCATLPDELPGDNVLAKTVRRVLMIVPWLAMGGADKFTLDLVQQLWARGWEVTLVTTLDGAQPWHAEFARYTPDIFVLPRFLPLVDYPRFLRYLAQSRRVDAMFVSHSELGYQLLPYLRAHLPEVPCLDFCHIEEQWKNGGYPRLAVEFQDLLDVNLVSSQHLKDWMIGRGADPARLQVCYTGVDTDIWRPDAAVRAALRAEWGIDDRLPVILYAGRICDQKQPRVFAATLGRLRERGVACLALVAGDGPDAAWLRHAVGKQGLKSSIRLLGAVPSGRVNQLMKAADILFLPSAWEGIAITVYEAMASGLAVVGANVGGQRELVTPECGVLIERSDEDREAEVYARILAELAGDPGRVRAMGAAGRARVEAGFQLADMGQCMVDQLDRATAWRQAQPRPGLSVGLGRALAAQVIELTRIGQQFDRLWHAANGGAFQRPGEAAGRADWRERLYAACRVLYGPLYRRGLERGGAWYFPLAQRVKALIVRPPERRRVRLP